jgi:ubiquinone/menaquinone biosynthesis C-methylase UbiE
MTDGSRRPAGDADRARASSSERERLGEFYGSADFRERHDPTRAGNRYISLTRHAAILDAVRRLCRETSARSYLEVGCGPGDELARIARADAGLAQVIGVEILLEELSGSKAVQPRMAVACADGAALPFRDASFDIVAQYMMLSSVPDPHRRATLGREMLRVLRPGGRIVSLDLRYPRLPPRGRVAVGRRSLRAIFPGLRVESSTHVLLPPLARLLAPWSARLCDLLGRVPFLRTYRLAVLKRPE